MQIEPSQAYSRSDLNIPEDSFSVALCVDPASAGDARRFVFFVALLEALNKPVVGVLPRASWNLERAVRWVRTAGPRWQFKVLDVPVKECWQAIDLGVMIAAPWVLDRDPAVLRARQERLVASAHRAGTPVLWSGPGLPEALYPGEAAKRLSCATDEPRGLARRATALLDDESEFERLTELVGGAGDG